MSFSLSIFTGVCDKTFPNGIKVDLFAGGLRTFSERFVASINSNREDSLKEDGVVVGLTDCFGRDGLSTGHFTLLREGIGDLGFDKLLGATSFMLPRICRWDALGEGDFDLQIFLDNRSLVCEVEDLELVGRFEAVLNAIRSLCFETDPRALFGDFDSSMRALLVDGV
mmetsp:Transcript_5651/g.8307  ORF Transcript_5651/g.8307 Transcript_5651/m.8307 type:complete len:168 (+) Transcript_5651:53-556(+)